ncbi:unnamed protein product [Blepharisma stoltei]|uniref:Uncharacterized protein n=1 Tax=Blepharisma stoltei TaxID=1481888 RepID=A0AAU9JV77_9CILI|nr:unnamed protein product [Blepharisma stoltei]
MEVFLCFKENCSQHPEFICRCAEPITFICSIHIADHISLTSSNHHIEKLYFIPNETSKKVIVNFLNEKINSLNEMSRKIYAKEVEKYNRSMELRTSISKQIHEDSKKLKNIIEMIRNTENVTKFEEDPLKKLLVLSPEEALENLKNLIQNDEYFNEMDENREIDYIVKSLVKKEFESTNTRINKLENENKILHEKIEKFEKEKLHIEKIEKKYKSYIDEMNEKIQKLSGYIDHQKGLIKSLETRYNFSSQALDHMATERCGATLWVDVKINCPAKLSILAASLVESSENIKKSLSELRALEKDITKWTRSLHEIITMSNSQEMCEIPSIEERIYYCFRKLEEIKGELQSNIVWVQSYRNQAKKNKEITGAINILNDLDSDLAICENLDKSFSHSHEKVQRYKDFFYQNNFRNIQAFNMGKLFSFKTREVLANGEKSRETFLQSINIEKLEKEEIKLEIQKNLLSTSIAYMPDNELFLYGNEENGIPSGLCFIYNVINSRIQILPEGPSSYNSGSAYYNNSVYIFGGQDTTGDLPIALKFDLIERKWIFLPPIPEPSSLCSCLPFNENLLFSGINHDKLYRYNIKEENYSIIDIDIVKDSTKILMSARGKAYIIDCQGLIYESNRGDENIWVSVTSASLPNFCYPIQRIFYDDKLYFTHKNGGVYEFLFDRGSISYKI